MPGLQHSQLEPTSPPASTSPGGSVPQLRVVTAEPTDRAADASLLDLFHAALTDGDLSRARDALLRFRDVQQDEREQLQQEKSELINAVRDLQKLLDDRCQAHEEELRLQKERLAAWHDQEKQALIADAEQSMAEIQQARDDLMEQCEDWEKERAEQAAALDEEQSRLDAVRKELDERHAEFDASTAEEYRNRLRLADEAVAQRENELAGRQAQFEQELTSQRKLHERQLALDRESFLRACSEREAGLDAIRSDIEKQRQKLVEDRCRTAERFAETRRQLEHDRSLIQDGLRQMEAQLRWVSSSISLCGGPASEHCEAGNVANRDDLTESTRVHSAFSTSTEGNSSSDRDARSEASCETARAESSTGIKGWAGVVTPRNDDSEYEPVVCEDSVVNHRPPEEESQQTDSERRKRLEDYRTQLTTLQASLSLLKSTATADESASVSPAGDKDSGEGR